MKKEKFIPIFAFILFGFVPMNAEKPNPVKEYEDFLVTKSILTKIKKDSYSHFQNDPSENNDLEKDIEYYLAKCKYKKIKNLTRILKLFSPVDSLLFLKQCSETKKEEASSFESTVKQKLFELSRFPKLEIIETELADKEVLSSFSELKRIWEDRVYLFSNFYSPHSLAWLGYEKEITEEINRIAYSDLPVHRKANQLNRIKEDTIQANKKLYLMFLYSAENPWNKTSLSDENRESFTFYRERSEKLLSDPDFPTDAKAKLEELLNCLKNINEVGKENMRLLFFYGFFYDYGMDWNNLGAELLKEEKSVLSYLKKTIYQSHHFEKRLHQIGKTCKETEFEHE
ncbi:hypothetical protein LPTSP3_g22520 [Leptospira kobayashii]|uniref:Uncharacterized protein n=1 Tax=Leptospira kobayashii TaxID=1917830 RepID=A0ABM7UKE9_9LEPT|nr:hypothetical protein [Leptospira kobayashii]BDA79322.1 hypothetical protein LPTSP3_g22520 [Leptospira kobayashii]